MNEKKIPLVSVVMPVYNAERFVAQAIESVLFQTHERLELILIDDCSTDHSLQIAQTYAAQDERVRVMVNECNQGVAKTRNAGIQVAQGEYIALLDSDDAWEKTKLEKQIRLMQEQEAGIVYCSENLVDEEGKLIKKFIVPPTTDYREMLVRCYFSCSTVLIQAALLKKHLFRTDFYHEDFLLWTELLALNVKAVGLPEVLTYYRQLSGSRSHSKFKAAANRWKIYREALGMSIWLSFVTFVRYAVAGIRKYYL